MEDAFSQVYYAAGILLHYVVPSLLPVKSVQKGQRRKGQVTSEALYSIGKDAQAALEKVQQLSVPMACGWDACSLTWVAKLHPTSHRPNAAGPLIVKAGVWTLVERLHARGHTKLYTGSPTDAWQVGRAPGSSRLQRGGRGAGFVGWPPSLLAACSSTCPSPLTPVACACRYLPGSQLSIVACQSLTGLRSGMGRRCCTWCCRWWSWTTCTTPGSTGPTACCTGARYTCTYTRCTTREPPASSCAGWKAGCGPWQLRDRPPAGRCTLGRRPAPPLPAAAPMCWLLPC